MDKEVGILLLHMAFQFQCTYLCLFELTASLLVTAYVARSGGVPIALNVNV